MSLSDTYLLKTERGHGGIFQFKGHKGDLVN